MKASCDRFSFRSRARINTPLDLKLELASHRKPERNHSLNALEISDVGPKLKKKHTHYCGVFMCTYDSDTKMNPRCGGQVVSPANIIIDDDIRVMLLFQTYSLSNSTTS